MPVDGTATSLQLGPAPAPVQRGEPAVVGAGPGRR